MSTKIEVLKQLFAAINRNDMQAITKDFDPEIVRIEPKDFPIADTYCGIADVQANIAKGRGTWAEGSCEPEEFLESGEKVVVYLHARVRLKGSTEWVGGRFADGFLFRNGKIIQYLSFSERAEALKWAGNLQTQPFYYGTRAELKPGDLIESSNPLAGGEQDGMTPYVYLTPNLDAAIWEAELAPGEGLGRVYIVEPIGPIEDVPRLTNQTVPDHLAMSWRSREPLRVMGEVTEWPLYHGTRADLKPGDLIKPGHTPNFGNRDRTTPHVYLTRTLDAATWGAELAAGEGPGRIYIVEPTGPIEDDPNLTNKKFRGNPTKSFRSRESLRVMGEIVDWQGHSPEALKVMKGGLEELEQFGVEPIDD